MIELPIPLEADSSAAIEVDSCAGITRSKVGHLGAYGKVDLRGVFTRLTCSEGRRPDIQKLSIGRLAILAHHKCNDRVFHLIFFSLGSLCDNGQSQIQRGICPIAVAQPAGLARNTTPRVIT